ncbi:MULTISPECIES: DUF4232 domain-containing protein [unclassified Streptomyces]|uniref:DUF4232 domain-containing protein n=1 Tax=unclassified Streptomyces TaxID=2593676 RepID=UPI0035D8A468
MRTQRKYTVLAVAGIAALSLGLTACGGNDGTRDEGSAASAGAPSAPAPAPTSSVVAGSSTSGGGSAAGGSDSGTGGSSATKTSKTSKSSSKAASCTHQDVKITAAKVDETPTEHIVLTATNTSGRACRLDGYPLIAFGEIQTAKDVPAVAKSKPAAPVVLEPGAPAYANVRIALGGAHEDNKVVTSFNVNLFAGSDPAEGSVVVKAPAGGLAVDEAAAKTGYWTPELRNGADEF